MQKTSNAKEIIKMPSVEKIPFFDKPPALGGQLSYLTQWQFKEKFGCEYSESLWSTDDQITQKYKNTLVDHPKHSILERGITKICAKANTQVAIGYINDNVGYGLFALEDICEATVLFFYSGTLVEKRESGDLYQQAINPTINLVISAKEKRGMAGFMQHLPYYDLDIIDKPYQAEKTERKNNNELTCDPKRVKANQEYNSISVYSAKSKNIIIAYKNVDLVVVSIDGFLVQAALTIMPIKKYQIIGNSYGLDYWLSLDAKPEIFSLNGHVLPYDCYDRKKYLQYFDHADLVELLLDFDPKKKISNFWKCIDTHNYSKALRMACTDKNHTNAITIVTTILLFKETLAINLDEKAGDGQQSAIHYAAKAGNIRLMDLLVSRGANGNLKDGHGKSAEHYLNEALRIKAENKALIASKATHFKVTSNDNNNNTLFKGMFSLNNNK